MFRTTNKWPAVETLRGLALFRACGDEELAQIDRLATWIGVETGRMLCQEGEVGREFFVVVSGAVIVTQQGRDLHCLGPGAAFGEMALVDLGPRVAAVKAIEPTELLVFNRAEFGMLLDRVPRVGRELLHTSTLRLREAEAGGAAVPAGSHSSVPAALG